MEEVTFSGSDSGFIKLLESYNDSPFKVSIFMLTLWILYVLYKERSTVLDLLRGFLLLRAKRKKLKKQDLLTHQVFKDLDFWIEYRINQLYSPDDSKINDKAKVAIGRDLLLIKFKNIREWLFNFVDTTNLDDPCLNIRSLFLHRIEKNASIQYSLLKDNGIPPLFINKFTEISRIHESYLSKCNDDILSDKVPLTMYERMYVLLGNFSTYLTTMLAEMNYVIQSINGDLKGIHYKHYIIGGNDYRCYPVPCRDYIPYVEDNLAKLSGLTKANRCCVSVFHDVADDDYTRGCFSKIYEYHTHGLSSSMQHFQYKSCAMLMDILPELKQHKSFTSKTSNLNPLFRDLTEKVGVEVVCIYPIFNKDRLRGFLEIAYTNDEAYANLDASEIQNNMKYYASLLNVYVDYSKDGLNFAGNEMK